MPNKPLSTEEKRTASEASAMYTQKNAPPVSEGTPDSGILGPGEQRPPQDGPEAAADASPEDVQQILQAEQQALNAPAAPAAPVFQEGAAVQGTIDRMEGDTPVIQVDGKMYNLVPVE